MLTRLRAWWRLMQRRWALLRSPHVEALERVEEILGSSTYRGALYACRKGHVDANLKAAHNEALRREAVEWAGHWYREAGLKPHPWDVRLAIELAVGHVKGYW